MVEVEIYDTGKHFLKGRLVDNSEIISPGLNRPLTKGAVSGFKEDMVGISLSLVLLQKYYQWGLRIIGLLIF